MRKSILAAILVFSIFVSACTVQNKEEKPAPEAAQPAAATQAAESEAMQAAQAPSERKISAEEAHSRMESGEPLVILDVRTAEEYEEKHIPGAVLLPNEDIGSAPPSIFPVLDTQILIYCRSGNRSAQAAEKLAAMGYTRAYDFGGINDWQYETESGAYQSPQKSGALSSFTTVDLNGIMRDESLFADKKLTMINIWATFCGPCLNEMPELGELSAAYADKGVQIVGIVVDVYTDERGVFDGEMVRTARDLAAQTGANYLHLLPSEDLNKAKLNQVMGVPETIFVDAQGNPVGESYIGSRSGGEWAQVLDSLLSQMNG